MIRFETKDDIERIGEILKQSFETDAESRLVSNLRTTLNGQPDQFISLVAEIDKQVVGQILFTPVYLFDQSDSTRIESIKVAGLAPMAVDPEHRKMKIGSRLVIDGIATCMEKGYDAIVVLGHPEYYPKFGFEPASHFQVKSEYDVPDEVFMAIELKEGSLPDTPSLVKYHEEFGKL